MGREMSFLVKINCRTVPTRMGKVCLLVLLCLSVSVSIQAKDRSEEYQLKAVLLGRLLQFITWPEELGPAGTALCIIGDNPFGESLDRVFSEQETPLIYFSENTNQIEQCKAVFLSESELRLLPSWLERLQNRPILSISDIPRFAVSGGMINLTFENRRVRFRINKNAADASELNLSFQLLNLSDIVESTTSGGAE